MTVSSDRQYTSRTHDWKKEIVQLSVFRASEPFRVTIGSSTGPKMKEKKLLKIQPLPKVLRVQAIRSQQLRSIYNCYIHAQYTRVKQ